jgi:hypothetical protein
MPDKLIEREVHFAKSKTGHPGRTNRINAKSVSRRAKTGRPGRTSLVSREVHFAKSKTGHPGRTN